MRRALLTAWGPAMLVWAIAEVNGWTKVAAISGIIAAVFAVLAFVSPWLRSTWPHWRPRLAPFRFWFGPMGAIAARASGTPDLRGVLPPANLPFSKAAEYACIPHSKNVLLVRGYPRWGRAFSARFYLAERGWRWDKRYRLHNPWYSLRGWYEVPKEQAAIVGHVIPYTYDPEHWTIGAADVANGTPPSRTRASRYCYFGVEIESQMEWSGYLLIEHRSQPSLRRPYYAARPIAVTMTQEPPPPSQ